MKCEVVKKICEYLSTELYIIINITINDSFGDPLSSYTMELLKTNGDDESRVRS